MSAQEQLEPISLLPNRFAVAEFDPREVEAILGADESQHVRVVENFNWLAAYLCEDVGIYGNEVADWFRMRAQGLGDRSPLAAWRTKDGFQEVMDYAQLYKQQVDENLADEEPESDMAQSHRLAEHALAVIFKGLDYAGVEEYQLNDGTMVLSRTIYNPDQGLDMTVRWKRAGDLEDYRITKNEGPRLSSYFIVRHMAMAEEPVILQTGIGRHSSLKADEGLLDVDTDIDGRPPSVAEVASFVVPLAAEVQNRSLVVMV